MAGELFERWYLRTLLALARRAENAEQIAMIVPRVASVDAMIAERRGQREAQLYRSISLSSIGIDFLSAAIAFSGDPRLPAHAEALGGPLARRGLSISTFCEVAELSASEGQLLVAQLDEDHELVTNGLLQCGDPLAAPAARPYQVPTRVLGHLAGDDRCDPGITIIEPDPEWLYDMASADALGKLARAIADAGAPLVVVAGSVGTGRRSAVAHVALRAIASIDAEQLDAASLDAAFVALRREAILRGAVPIIANADAFADEIKRRTLPRLIEHYRKPLVLTTWRGGLDLTVSRPTIRIDWPLPAIEPRRQLWIAAIEKLGRQSIGDLEQLATRYRVGPGAIARGVTTAAALYDDKPLDATALASGLRHNVGERMSGLAERVEVVQEWNDIVLADDIREQIDTLIARVRHTHQVLDRWGFRSRMARGAGVAAMFSGPPGTGKTMVSGLIARELDLELYQVDLSQIVSKWIGETEKQLARVFDAAEEGHVLLLFDEADALFAQRSSEVKGATDRYANLEVNFLLQRIESFGGVTILTTNLDASVDRALKRRLAAHIVFGTPDEDERTELWSRLVQTGSAPIARGIEFGEFARAFPSMTGANIRNAVSSAAFMAAAEQAREITEDHLLRAGRSEYRSMGHILSERGLSPSGGRTARRVPK